MGITDFLTSASVQVGYNALNLIPFFNQLGNLSTQWSNSVWANNLLDPATYYQALILGIIDEKTYNDLMKKLGYNNDQATIYRFAQEQVNDMNAILSLDLKGLLSDEQREQLLKLIDVPIEVYNNFKRASRWYPSPDRIIQWANRDIFNQATIDRYTLNSGKPKNLDTMLLRAGADPDVVQYLWLASWQYPSFYEGKYMYDWSRAHPADDKNLNPDGLTFNLDDFKYLMRVSNYPEYFQKLYTKILSNPLTYREIAELYHYEIIKEEDMHRWLAWAGYDEEQIDVLQKLFKVMYSPEGKKRSKHYTLSVVESLYEYAKIDKEQFIKYLTELGYDKESATLYCEYIDLRKELEDEKLLIREVELNVKENVYDIDTAYEILTQNKVAPNLAKYLINYWKIKYQKRQHAIGESTLAKMCLSNIITLDEYKQQMKLHGYSDKQIDWFVTFYGLNQSQKKGS